MTQSANATRSMMRNGLRSCALWALVATLLAVSAVPVVVQARNDSLQELTFTSLDLKSDRKRIGLTDIIHLTVSAHVREHIGHFDHVTLANLAGFQIQGDEHHVSETARGTDYLQILTLSPQKLGTYALGPVRIEAINHITQQRSLFSSTPVSIDVVAFDPGEPVMQMLVRTAILLVIAMVIGLIAFHFCRLGIAYLIGKLPGRKPLIDPDPQPEVEFVPEPPPTPARTKSRLEHLRQVMQTARRNPDRQRALELRIALRDAVGAHPDETLSDVVVRMPDGERGLLARALRAAERAAFIDDEARTTSIEEGLVVIEAACVRLERDK